MIHFSEDESSNHSFVNVEHEVSDVEVILERALDTACCSRHQQPKEKSDAGSVGSKQQQCCEISPQWPCPKVVNVKSGLTTQAFVVVAHQQQPTTRSTLAELYRCKRKAQGEI